MGWLNSYHSFSFGHYYDPQWMGFGDLRVINDDTIAAGGGFAPHPHDNMEIVTYVLSGELAHEDSMGNGSVIQRGDVQRMSAGTGIVHSEFNHSDEQPTKLLQIWFLPDQRNVEPSYEQKHFSDAEKKGQFCLVASKAGLNGSVSLHQDVNMFVTLLDGDDQVDFEVKPDRQAWVQVAEGSVVINGEFLQTGDAFLTKTAQILRFDQAEHAELVLFDGRLTQN